MITCVHCNEAAISALFNDEDSLFESPFCCQGCLTVYNIIHAKGLAAYYDIKKASAVYKRRSPVELRDSKFTYLNDSLFLKEYSYSNSNHESIMEFYLEGIHCLACLWLVEKLPEFLDNIKTTKLDLERSVVTVVLEEGGKFSDVASELSSLGYRPHPLKINQDSAEFKTKEERLALIRIGVAGAAAGNIMLYAVSLYGGATQEFSGLFNLLTVLFAVPVLTFCAFPLYRNAWQALKNHTVSIDIPISIALIVGAVMGVYNLVMGIPENYFDSLSTLVFLLLLSRYFLHKIQEKGLSATDLQYFYQVDTVLKANDDRSGFIQMHPSYIKVGDLLKIPPGSFMPIDGLVISGTSYLNNSLLTGESLPVKVKPGEMVYSGTQNIDQELLIEALKVEKETRLGGILKNVEDGWAHRSETINLTNKISKSFTLAVFFLALVLFIYLYNTVGIHLAFEQAITLLIVTCPCALALATPLAFTRSLSKAAKHGIIIKSDAVIESVAKIKNIFLDKTGTITYGKLRVVDFKILKIAAIDLDDVIAHLEAQSRHPVALALMDSIKGKVIRPYTVSDKKEILGVGVSGYIEGNFYQINRQGIFENNVHIAQFTVEDSIRSDSKQILKSFLAQDLGIKLLSGDSEIAVNKICAEIDLPLKNAFSGLSPENKSDLIKSTESSMMVGDGANDAIAMSTASVGVAVFGAMDISLRAADVYLTIPGLAPLEKLVILSQETMKVVRRNLVLSLIYNSLSVTAAFMGLISPLVAAIIMPLSSLTVLISTLMGTNKMRSLWKS